MTASEFEPAPDAPIALVDLDGTLVDYDGAMARALAAIRAPGEPEASHVHGPGSEDNIPWLKERIRLIRNQPGWWRELREHTNGMYLARLLSDAGYRLHVLTKGPRSAPNAWMEKTQWCRDHLDERFGYPVPVTVTADKGLVYGKVLVDDWPPYIEAWLKWRPRGLVIMPTHPWNKDAFTHGSFAGQVIRFSGEVEEAQEIKERLRAQLAPRGQT